MIAWYAGADYIVPTVLTALVAWNNMVDGEFFCRFATILAGEFVA